MNTNKKLAIASLAGSLFFPVASVVAGIVSLVRGNKNKEQDNGFYFALSGIIVGGINFIVRKMIFVLLVVVPFLTISGITMNGMFDNMKPHSYVNSEVNDNCDSIVNNSDGFVDDSVFKVACEVLNMDERSAIEYINAQGMTARVAVRDEEFIALTMDYRNDRINLSVKDNKVFDTNVG